jgi:hypothetical protein
MSGFATAAIFRKAVVVSTITYIFPTNESFSLVLSQATELRLHAPIIEYFCCGATKRWRITEI